MPRKKWGVYSQASLQRLNPGEKFFPGNVRGDELETWLNERGYDWSKQYLDQPNTLKRQKTIQQINPKESYDLRLNVNYESNMFDSNKPKKIKMKKYYKLTSHHDNQASNREYQFYWQLNEKKYLLRG